MTELLGTISKDIYMHSESSWKIEYVVFLSPSWVWKRFFIDYVYPICPDSEKLFIRW